MRLDDLQTMFGVLYAAEGSSTEAVQEVALEFSPRIEVNSPREVTIDLSGLTRLFGDARAMGEALGRTAADRGLRVRLAIAGTRTAARLLAHGSSEPLTIVNPGDEAAALAGLPVHLLTVLTPDESVIAPSHLARRTPAPSHPRTLAPSHDIVSPLSAVGACARSERWRHCRQTPWRRGSDNKEYGGSGLRVGKIHDRSCLWFLKNVSNRLSISSGRSRAWSRSLSCSDG